MAEPSRGRKISRRGWLMAGLVAPLFPAKAADPLIVTFDGDNLHVSSFGVHFLRGKSLQKLKDGSTVVYLAALSMYRDAFVSQIRRSEFRFSVSYDVLTTGDRFAVSTPGPSRRQGANLSLSATENWCLENVVLPTAGIPTDRQVWLQLELKTALPRLSILGDSGFFIDVIEALTPGSNERQTFQLGPVKLAELVKTPRRGRAG